MKKICPYCKSNINYLNHQQYAGHCAGCKLNPNFINRMNKLFLSNKIRFNKHEYIFKCKKCNKEYKLILTNNQYKNNIYRKHCSRHCANIKICSEKKKENLHNLMKGKKYGLINHYPCSKEHKQILSIKLKQYYSIPENILKRSIIMKNSEKVKLAHNNPEYKLKCSNNAKENNFGGKRNSKRFWYKNICLDSSYELRVAEDLDKNNIKWIRPTRIKYFDKNNVYHYYLPDFYLSDYNIYLDPKNDYLINKDSEKIKLVEEQNKINIIILNKNELNWNIIQEKIRAFGVDS
jgi:uncharacterized protein YbaR (Trm112 family)